MREFLEGWNQAMWYLAYGSFVLSILIYIYYRVRAASLKTSKEKYDYISNNEINFFLAANVALALVIVFPFNTIKSEAVAHSWVWFVIRMFISICLGTLHVYVAHLVLKYYYPAKQHKRLEVLRYKPRINPKTGNAMKLLSEDEEDAYLDEGMQAEEDVFSVDYDVWIDVETGDTLIEKYAGRLHAMQCDRCGFHTLKLDKEEIIKEATEDEDGEIHKEWKCTYCKRIKRKNVKLSKTKSEHDFSVNDNTKFVDDPLGLDLRVSLVKMEIHSNKGEIREFEFKNLRNAQNFLKEFDFAKLKEEEGA
ncbi:MAG: hypothetical protein JXQ96_05020 [Cyclobacteriaceae bacterium]